MVIWCMSSELESWLDTLTISYVELPKGPFPRRPGSSVEGTPPAGQTLGSSSRMPLVLETSRLGG